MIVVVAAEAEVVFNHDHDKAAVAKEKHAIAWYTYIVGNIINQQLTTTVLHNSINLSAFSTATPCSLCCCIHSLLATHTLYQFLEESTQHSSTQLVNISTKNYIMLFRTERCSIAFCVCIFLYIVSSV